MKINDLKEKIDLDYVAKSFWFNGKTGKLYDTRALEHLPFILDNLSLFGLDEKMIYRMTDEDMYDKLFANSWVRGFLWNDPSGGELTLTGDDPSALRTCAKAIADKYHVISLTIKGFPQFNEKKTKLFIKTGRM